MPILEAEQRAVVDAPLGHLSVLACAGSGKTTVVVERIARLVESGAVTGERVAAITFTNMAARELEERLEKRLGADHAGAWPLCGTIHSFCLTIMKEFEPKYAALVNVLTEGKQFALLYKHFSNWGLERLAPEGASRGLVIDSFIRTVEVVGLESVPLSALTAAHPEFAEVYSQYQAWCAENNYLDYTSILVRFKKCLDDSLFVRFLSERIGLLVVDEYQDTDPIQEHIFLQIGALMPVMVVADDDQCIYQFRGTDVRNILRFTKDFGGAVQYPLSKNFRCGSNIVKLADAVVSKVKQRSPKNLSAAWDGAEVVCREFEDIAAEAEFVASTIATLAETNQIRDWGEIAILLRSVASYSDAYVENLRSRGLPVAVVGGRGLFASFEIQVLQNALEFVGHPESNDEALQYLLGAVAPGKELQLKDESFEDFGEADWLSHGLTGAATKRIHNLVDVKHRFAQRKFNSFLELYLAVVSALEFLLENSTDLQRRNVGILSQIVADYDDVAPGVNVRYLLNYLKAYAARSFDAAQPVDPTVGAINVMTIHQAKGLEFQAVFIPMVVEKRFPSEAASKKFLVDERTVDLSRYLGSQNDERRLFYVAVTRAKSRLFLTAPRNVGLANPKSPSIFFLEAVQHAAHGHVPEVRASQRIVSLDLSYSTIEYYLSCPFRYQILFDIGLQTPVNPFFEYGRLIHLVLRLIHESYARGEPMSELEAMEVFDTHFPKKLPVPVLTQSAIRRKGKAALAAYIRTRTKWLKSTYKNEMPFILRDEKRRGNLVCNISLVGQIDLVCKHDGAISIVDFKTGQPHDYIRTDLQLQLYAIALKEHYGLRATSASVYYVEHDKEVSYAVDDKWLLDGQLTLDKVTAGILNRHFRATPGTVCGRCELKAMCPYRKAS